MSRTGALILLVLVAVAIISWWLKSSIPEMPARQPKELQQSDYFMTDFDIRQYDSQGGLEYRMRGRRIEHYPADDSAIIDHPELSVKPGRPGQPWTVSARLARAPSRALDKVIFQGAVDMRRPASPDAAALTLNTERLVIRPGAERIVSDETVVITRPGARIEGRNLVADLKRGIVRLDRVRGRYAP